MFFLDELDNLKIYRKQFLLPLDEKNKRKGSMTLLMGAGPEASIGMMQNHMMVPRYYQSYYLERAVMYYINHEHGMLDFNLDNEKIDTVESIDESIEDVMDKSSKITYRGYEHDIDLVKQYINPGTIKRFNADYKKKVKHPLTVNIVGRAAIRENTANQIWILSPSLYNKSLASYELYCYYKIMETIVIANNPKIDKDFKYAIALYDSGLGDAHISSGKWIFGKKLKTTYKAIDAYVKKEGHKRFVRDKLYDYSSFTFETIKDTASKAMENIFFNESAEVPNLGNEDMMMLNEDMALAFPITEDASYNSALKRILYGDRFKTLNDLKDYYETVKKKVPYIKYTYTDIGMYNGMNLYVDMAHYMYSYVRNATVIKERGFRMMTELLDRLINDKRYTDAGYKKKTIIFDIHSWKNLTKADGKRLWHINDTINPFSCIYQLAVTNPAKLQKMFKDSIVLVLGYGKYFKLDFSTINMKTFPAMFIRYIRFLSDDVNDGVDIDTDTKKSSPKAIKTEIIDKVEKSQGIEINDISTDIDDKSKKTPEKKTTTKTSKEKKPADAAKVQKEEDKKELVRTVAKAAEKNDNAEDTMSDLDQSEELKEIIAALSSDAEKKSNISAARASRMIKLQNDIMDKKFKDTTVGDLVSKDFSRTELREKSIPVESVNKEWSSLKFPTQEEVYDMDSDIVEIFNSFADKEYPLVLRSIQAMDSSTSEDAIMTYIAQYENADGKRFTVKVDIPKWVDNKYMVLRGNKKDLPNQLFLMPISKTDTDTVQIVSNYNKIFIRRFGTTTGKSFITADRLIKTINKNTFPSLSVIRGDNEKICNRYELPIDYVDLASVFTKLETSTISIWFNQDSLRKEYGDKIDEKNGIPIGVDRSGNIIYWNSIIGTDKEFMSCSAYIELLLSTDANLAKEGFEEKFRATSKAVRYTYSKASILTTQIPVIVLCAYSEGLTKTLKKANIKYRIESSKRSVDDFKEDYVRFNDAYLIYELDYASSLLMNGLKACDTTSFSIAEIDSKNMYLNFLDSFGGRIKADGLDNFYNLMIDKPITYNTLVYYNLPTDYVELLLYANRLLADNKFYKHTNLTNNRRVRRHEQIPAILYSQLAHAYGMYCNNIRHGMYAPMSLKQSAVVDETLTNSTTSDKSIINALGEFEAYNAVTPKGPSGMNSDRSYTLDKRSFDKSMLNIVAMSTGFAGNVGINRQMTIDANVNTARGYIRETEEDMTEYSPTKTFCMTEALTPFGSTRDDPFRTAMTFIQTSKHGIRCKRSDPGVITSGADEALPYMISNIFAYKSKKDGVVKEINEERMIVEYKDGSHEYIDLSQKIEKNSSSGFYVILKLDTDLKEGSKVKAGDILAYDKSSFSNEFGMDDNISYNIGTFAKFAVLNTDEGFEDSSIISQDLSDAMTSNIVLKIDKTFNKNTNIYNMVKVGQAIEEGDTLFIAQSSFEEEDVNALLRNLTAEDEDEITELGRVPIKSKVTGRVEDIKIYRTVELDELSPTLKKLCSDYERKIKTRKKEMEKYGVENIDIVLGPNGKLEPTGKLKNADDGVYIEIYLTYEDRMSVGDKLIYYSANKGVVKDIFPAGKEPRSDYRPNEKIHSLLASDSINGRMVGSILINGGIGKVMVELARQCKDILGIKYSDNLFE